MHVILRCSLVRWSFVFWLQQNTHKRCVDIKIFQLPRDKMRPLKYMYLYPYTCSKLLSFRCKVVGDLVTCRCQNSTEWPANNATKTQSYENGKNGPNLVQFRTLHICTCIVDCSGAVLFIGSYSWRDKSLRTEWAVLQVAIQHLVWNLVPQLFQRRKSSDSNFSTVVNQDLFSKTVNKWTSKT